MTDGRYYGADAAAKLTPPVKYRTFLRYCSNGLIQHHRGLDGRPYLTDDDLAAIADAQLRKPTPPSSVPHGMVARSYKHKTKGRR